MCAKNMWGDLKDIEKIRTPLGILREQAIQLDEATDGILVGGVTSRKYAYSLNEWVANLNIVAPALDNYSYEVLEVKYPLDLYPLSLTTSVLKKHNFTECKLEKDFLQALEDILSSRELRQIIQNLISQCES